MHNEVREYINKVKAMFPKHFENWFVLDVGSLDINGNNREFFNGSNYTWIDIVRWPNVEYVCSIVDWKTPIKYNVVISTEMLEHNKDWKESLFKMYKLLRKFWLLIVTCAGINRREHWTTKNSPKTVLEQTTIIGTYQKMIFFLFFQMLLFQNGEDNKI